MAMMVMEVVDDGDARDDGRWAWRADERDDERDQLLPLRAMI